ncbi:WYL domain-containing protein [Pseudalkalibacillus sp. Hm43]|uniref:WYL domain-containing protein n=1 Tax=Pseudalkalibacillus sp. Hm43 TaxID=3450742 RepID=UPI003F4445E2
MKRMLVRAYEQNKPIEIVYLANDESITQRVIWISSMTDTTMTAFCSLRKQTRTFQIDRVLSCRILPYRRNQSNNHAG